jgi:hypothetical protein
MITYTTIGIGDDATTTSSVCAFAIMDTAGRIKAQPAFATSFSLCRQYACYVLC